jgi:hypothetical protein
VRVHTWSLCAYVGFVGRCGCNYLEEHRRRGASRPARQRAVGLLARRRMCCWKAWRPPLAVDPLERIMPRDLLLSPLLASCRLSSVPDSALVPQRSTCRRDLDNTGFPRYLKTTSDKHFAIDPDKVEEEKKFDGVFLLRTNTDLNPLEGMLCYKQLWRVEQTFRTAKHLLSTRPIFHKLDETIRRHVFCSFLTLAKKALQDRISALGRSGSWPQIIADLDSLTETEIEHDGKRFVVRCAPRPAASLAIRAAGVPPTVRQVAD